MRVLYVVHDFLPNHPSGAEVYTGQLARRVAERGHDVRVFASEKDVSRPHLRLDRREWEGLVVHELVNNLFYDAFEETWDWPPAERAFESVLDEFRPDVVHFMHLLYLSAGCVEAAARRSIPILFTLHDFWLQCARFGQRLHADGAICDTIDFERCGTCLATLKYALSGVERRTARVLAGVRSATGLDLKAVARGAADLLRRREPERPAAVPAERAARFAHAMALRDRALAERVVPHVSRFFAPSEFLRERFLEWGIPAPRIERLDYGIDTEPFAGPFAPPPRDPDAPVRVAFLGTLVRHKGPHLLLEAWGRLPAELRARARLAIHGPKHHQPDYVAELARLAASVGATLSGALARAAVPAMLRETDLLVVPSTWYENQPLTILEARVTRTPVVVADLGGMAELVAEGRTGWRFRAGDAGDLAVVLRRVLSDPEALATLPFDTEPVKDMRTSAQEMVARYEAALAATGGGAA